MSFRHWGRKRLVAHVFQLEDEVAHLESFLGDLIREVKDAIPPNQDLDTDQDRRLREHVAVLCRVMGRSSPEPCDPPKGEK